MIAPAMSKGQTTQHKQQKQQLARHRWPRNHHHHHHHRDNRTSVAISVLSCFFVIGGMISLVLTHLHLIPYLRPPPPPPHHYQHDHENGLKAVFKADWMGHAATPFFSTIVGNSTKKGEGETKQLDSSLYHFDETPAKSTSSTNQTIFKGHEIIELHKSQLLEWDRKQGWDQPNATFGACLLVMDDNHRLSEWIAYHYYALPLRTLVVTVDPRSRTLPHSVLQTWQPLLDITVWSDENLTLDRDWRMINESDTDAKTILHRIRQATFYRDCTTYLKDRGLHWVTYHDVDEYVVPFVDSVPDYARMYLSRPGGIMTLFRALMQTQSHYQYVCITLPRLLVGALESPPEQIHHLVPRRWAHRTKAFETLRYRYRAHPSWTRMNGPVKSWFHVQYAPMKVVRNITNSNGTTTSVIQQAWQKMYNVHHLIGHKRCAPTVTAAPIVLYHYLGSYDSYTARDDARWGSSSRSLTQYRSKAHIGVLLIDPWGGSGYGNNNRTTHAAVDDTIQPWIGAFVRHVGDPLADYLLQSVGVLEHHPLRVIDRPRRHQV